MDFSKIISSLSPEEQVAFENHTAQAKLDTVEETSKNTQETRKERAAVDEDEAHARQDARSSAVPSTQAELVDSLTQAFSVTQALQQQRESAFQPGAFRVQQHGIQPTKFDGVVRNGEGGEDGESKLRMFETQMIKCFGQHECPRAIESEIR